jgi:methylenetetrahydrofolate--tRNA-(uracil-5-)-methyltransferase
LYFFDAIAPIVDFNSINFDIAYFGDRYGKGNNDYINLPMNKEQYLTFYNELINAETVQLKDFENTKVFEGCMPVEVMAKRGVDTLRYGMLKPVGLINPKTDAIDYAVVQLRRETNNNDLFNMVGFQTNLTYPEQKRVFRLIPGLEKAEFYRYGVMHRNTFINAPKNINKYYQLKNYPNIFIAGQLSGVEGYIESISSGLMCGINMANYLNNKPLVHFTSKTMIGALSEFIANANENNFQPMNSNFGIVDSLNERVKNKKEKNTKIATISLKTIDEILQY